MSLELPEPFPRMSYAEAMRRYGSDKPDLRVKLELIDVADLVRDCDFKVFAAPAADPAGRVAVLRVPGGSTLTRKELDDYAAFVARYGAKGLAYIKVNDPTRGARGCSPRSSSSWPMQRSQASSSAVAHRPMTCCSSEPTAPRSSAMPWARCG